MHFMCWIIRNHKQELTANYNYKDSILKEIISYEL
jgi:hypothetical protein